MNSGKIYQEFFIILIGFLGLWFLLSRIDFRRHLSLEDTGRQLEEKIGDLIWQNMSNRFEVVDDSLLKEPVMKIFGRLCDSNDLATEDFNIQIVRNEDKNALALPGARIVIFTGMITECQQAEELAGVIAHEMAHITENHIMEKMIREIGLSVLVGMTSGSGPESIGQLSKLLIGLSFDRGVEEVADQIGTDMLRRSGIDPQPLAHLFYRMGSEDGTDMPEWLSTHPEPLERSVDLATDLRGDTTSYRPLMTYEQWQGLQRSFSERN